MDDTCVIASDDRVGWRNNVEMLKIGRVEGYSFDFDKDFVRGDGGNGYIVLDTTALATDGLAASGVDESCDDAAVGDERLHGRHDDNIDLG